MKSVPVLDPTARGISIAGLILAVFFATMLLRVYVKLHILLPARMKRRIWTTRDPELQTVDPATLPEHISVLFKDAAAQLAALGFAAALHYRHREGQRSSQLIADEVYSFWIGQSDNVMAQFYVARFIITPGRPPIDLAVVAFITEFIDNASVQTNNLARPRPLVPLPSDDVLSCPGLRNLSRLLAVHLARVSQLSNGRTAVLPVAGSELEFIRRANCELWDHQIKIGHYHLDAEGKLRLTWRGVRAMHKQMSPVSKMHYFKGEEQRLRNLLD